MTETSTRAPDEPARGIFSIVAILTVARTGVNMTRRFTYAFVPEIARALGVPTSSVQNAITLQSSAAILSPALGGLSERFGRKYVMIAAMLASGALGLIGAIAPVYGVFLAVMAGFGLSKTLFDPAALAYMGDRVPYRRRAAAVGVNEMSWGAALLIAAPLTGLLLERTTLGHVFLTLATASFIGAAVVFAFLPGDKPKGEVTRIVSLRSILRAVAASPAAVGAVGYAALNSAANEMIFINYGAFMEQSFGLALSAVGIVTIAISVAEAVGEGAVAAIGDKFGPKRMAIIGAALAAICYGLFPLFSLGLPVVVGGIFMMFLGYEIAVVAAIPLYTEIMPMARASMMAAVIGSVAVGRVAGGLIGTALFNNAGVTVNAAVASAVMVIGIIWLWRMVHVQAEHMK